MNNLEKKIDLLVSPALAEDDATRRSIKDALAAQVQENRPVVKNPASLKQTVTNILHEIGVPAHIKGYKYLRESIIIVVNDMDVINAITKELYPRVADTFQTTPSRVERAIRHAIEVAWDRGDLDTLQRFFGHTTDANKGKTTNSEFIALVADYILVEGEKNEMDKLS